MTRREGVLSIYQKYRKIQSCFMKKNVLNDYKKQYNLEEISIKWRIYKIKVYKNSYTYGK
jgi:hypothetical protein